MAIDWQHQWCNGGCQRHANDRPDDHGVMCTLTAGGGDGLRKGLQRMVDCVQLLLRQKTFAESACLRQAMKRTWRKQLMLHVAELVPRHPGRTKKQEPTTSAAAGSKSGKAGKKKR
ncbi:hypothetical protein SASPL_148980 [Salvia splendens]|uniref:Uncharacterized protein n=1 Tax=Salvia splendens TaxID=180675 RepID=A0A8X8Z3X8_SALSN|nr:hypothetical protein SASPL_148980 [Salvia splendens]